MKRRVVVTGLGAITPVGNDVDTMWSNLKSGKSGIDFIRSFDASGIKVKIAAEVKDLNIKDHFKRKDAKRLDLFSIYAIISARQAVKDSLLDRQDINPYRFGVILGNGVGGMNTIYEEAKNYIEKGHLFVNPLLMPKAIPNMATGNVSIDLGFKGISNTVITACASGTSAIGEAFRAIQHGAADFIVCGGTEACINPLTLSGFANLNALSLKNDPSTSSTPFDAQRDGFVLGEGAAMLTLEEYDHAIKRKAKIYAEIVGYGFSSDAYHMTAPDPEAKGGIKSMRDAIEDAGIDPSDISYINAHGTSTPHNDSIETLAIKEVFKEDAYRIPVSSTKSMVGHSQGAAGAIEAVACVKSIQDGFIHPTTGYKNKDQECDLDYVPNTGKEKDLKYVLSNSLGFGGHNASIILKKL